MQRWKGVRGGATSRARIAVVQDTVILHPGGRTLARQPTFFLGCYRNTYYTYPGVFSNAVPARPTRRLKHPVNSVLAGKVTNDRRVGRGTTSHSTMRNAVTARDPRGGHACHRFLECALPRIRGTLNATHTKSLCTNERPNPRAEQSE